MKAQQVKEVKERWKEKAKGREPKLGPRTGHPSPRSESFGGKFENAEKDVGDPEDSLGMSQMYRWERKIGKELLDVLSKSSSQTLWRNRGTLVRAEDM